MLISVHLKPGSGTLPRKRRQHELLNIGNWIAANDSVEHDFIILGDMNIYNGAELTAATPSGFVSLNDELRATNTSPKSPHPYDHVMFDPVYSTEVDQTFDCGSRGE